MRRHSRHVVCWHTRLVWPVHERRRVAVGGGQRGMCSTSWARGGERRASKRERRELATQHDAILDTWNTGMHRSVRSVRVPPRNGKGEGCGWECVVL